VVVWNGNEVVYVAQVGDDPAIAAYQWAQAFPAHSDDTDHSASTEGGTSHEGTTTGDKGGGGNGGGGGGGGCGSPQSCMANILLGAGPMDVNVDIQKGTTERVDVTITEGPLRGATLSILVTVDKFGKVTEATASCSGNGCPEHLTVARQGANSEYISVQLVRDGGDHEQVIKSGADEKRTKSTDLNVGLKVTSNVELGGSGEAKAIHLNGKLTGDTTIDGNYATKKGSERNSSWSNQDTIKRLAPNPMSVFLTVRATGPDPVRRAQPDPVRSLDKNNQIVIP
jgi:hypothetical protein